MPYKWDISNVESVKQLGMPDGWKCELTVRQVLMVMSSTYLSGINEITEENFEEVLKKAYESKFITYESGKRKGQPLGMTKLRTILKKAIGFRYIYE